MGINAYLGPQHVFLTILGLVGVDGVSPPASLHEVMVEIKFFTSGPLCGVRSSQRRFDRYP